MRRKSSLRDEAIRAQRRALTAAAARILADEGPAGLSLRRLAEAVGASTTVAYTLFGGKQGLAHALREEGFARLTAAFEITPRGADPLANLRALGFAYREWARADPAWFSIMTERALGGVAPPSAREVRQTGAYRLFAGEVRACLEAKRFARGPVEEIADGLWGTAHGMVTLELAGYFPSERIAATRFARALTAAATGYTQGTSL